MSQSRWPSAARCPALNLSGAPGCEGKSMASKHPHKRIDCPNLEPPPDENKSPPENMEIKIKRAKEIIAGQVRPPRMPTPPTVTAFLERAVNGRQPPAEPEAVQKITDWLNLQAHYGGGPVACFTTAEGFLAVLAAGPEEVEALLKGLSDEEGARVVVEYPEPPDEIHRQSSMESAPAS